MKIVKLNAGQFDKFATCHRYRNYFQSSMYANVMVKFGYNAKFLGFANKQNKLVGATLILYKEVFMGNKVAYAPRGILANYENPEILREMVEALKKTLGKQGFMLLRMDPYIPLTIRDIDGNIINFNNKGNEIIDNLKSVGFSYKGKNNDFENEKPRWEALVILQRDIREIYAKLDKRTRSKLRRAANNGVKIITDPERKVNKLYEFAGKKDKRSIGYYKELARNFGEDLEIYYAVLSTETFVISSRRNYEKEQEYNAQLAEKIQDMSLSPKDRELFLNKKMESDKLITSYKNSLLKSTDLLKENPNGIIIGAAMVIKYDNAAYLISDGVDETYAYLSPNYLLKWQLISDFNEMGYKYVNLNAVVGEFEKKTKYAGLNESKSGFSTTLTEYIGEFDIVLNSFSYNLYNKMNNK